MPAILPIEAVAHQGADVAVAVEYLGLYPNGFTIHVAILPDPHHGWEMHRVHGGGGLRIPRVGVRFADGRVGGNRAGMFHPGSVVAKNERGLPTDPFVGFGSGGGGPQQGWRLWRWVYPLPPDGPLEIFVGLPAAGLEEASITVDGGAVREAAQRARVIWS